MDEQKEHGQLMADAVKRVDEAREAQRYAETVVKTLQGLVKNAERRQLERAQERDAARAEVERLQRIPEIVLTWDGDAKPETRWCRVERAEQAEAEAERLRAVVGPALALWLPLLTDDGSLLDVPVKSVAKLDNFITALVTYDKGDKASGNWLQDRGWKSCEKCFVVIHTPDFALGEPELCNTCSSEVPA